MPNLGAPRHALLRVAIEIVYTFPRFSKYQGIWLCARCSRSIVFGMAMYRPKQAHATSTSAEAERYTTTRSNNTDGSSQLRPNFVEKVGSVNRLCIIYGTQHKDHRCTADGVG